MIWTSDAGLKVDKFPGYFLGCQFTGGWYPTGWLSVEVYSALLSPWFEVFDFAGSFRVLHPLNNLSHGNEVDIIMVG